MPTIFGFLLNQAQLLWGFVNLPEFGLLGPGIALGYGRRITSG
jgi:hypothetical protein